MGNTHFDRWHLQIVSLFLFLVYVYRKFLISLINLNYLWTNLPPMMCFSARHCLSPTSGSKVAAVTGELPTTAGVEATCAPNVTKNRALRAAATGSTGAYYHVMKTQCRSVWARLKKNIYHIPHSIPVSMHTIIIFASNNIQTASETIGFITGLRQTSASTASNILGLTTGASAPRTLTLMRSIAHASLMAIHDSFRASKRTSWAGFK